MLPAELVERILHFADGCLLWKARRVCKLWKQICDFLILQRKQMQLCCAREMDPLTLSELSSAEPDYTAVYRAWYRHGRIARWPASTLAASVVYGGADTGTVSVAALRVADESILVTSTGWGVSVSDVSGTQTYELPGCGDNFRITQLAISRPAGGDPRRRLLALGYLNNLVRVTGLWHGAKGRPLLLPPVALRTRTGQSLSVSASGDLVAVGYLWETWLYRVRLSDHVEVATVCVVDLSSAADGWSRAVCCSDGLAFLALRDGLLSWCEAVEVAPGQHGTLPYAVLQLRPQSTPEHQLTPDQAVQPEDVLAVCFNTANAVVSLGADVLLGHQARGFVRADAFTTLRSRVTVCRLHGRLLLLGTGNGTLAVYFSPSERSLPDLEISKPAARLKLSDTALRTLLVLEETTCLRVLALDDDGALKQCFWQSPVGGRRFWRDPAAMMLSQ